MATPTKTRAGQSANGAVAAPAATALRPLPDPPRDIDAMQQFSHISTFANILSARLSQRPDAFVSGEGYLCRYRGQTIGRLVPDCIAAFGVDPDAISDANAYILDEIGKPPDFVLEVASESTGRNDYTHKRYAYARFDAAGGVHHDAPLAGDVLVGDAYSPIEIREGADGLITGYSAALGLELHWDDGNLRLYDPVARRYLRTLSEANAAAAQERAARLAAGAAMEQERAARLTAEATSEQERAARLASEARAEGATAALEEERAARLASEAENRRLRQELNRRRSDQ